MKQITKKGHEIKFNSVSGKKNPEQLQL